MLSSRPGDARMAGAPGGFRGREASSPRAARASLVLTAPGFQLLASRTENKLLLFEAAQLGWTLQTVD